MNEIDSKQHLLKSDADDEIALAKEPKSTDSKAQMKSFDSIVEGNHIEPSTGSPK